MTSGTAGSPFLLLAFESYTARATAVWKAEYFVGSIHITDWVNEQTVANHSSIPLQRSYLLIFRNVALGIIIIANLWPAAFMIVLQLLEQVAPDLFPSIITELVITY